MKKKASATPAIRLWRVTKQYILHHEKPTLVEQFIKKRNEVFTALDEISLEIQTGEKVGFVGPNGAGKTTMFKIIAGITAPTRGAVEIKGKIVSLIDLEVGFHYDLTGEQNIYLNGMLLGMSKRETTAKLKQIMEFAGIGRFIDAPLFTYSGGMKLRLGFSVAVHANPDILILDEGINVGDKDFQEKSKVKIQEFFRQGKTILVATHWLDFIKQNCTRVIILSQGKIAGDGPVSLLSQYAKRE